MSESSGAENLSEKPGSPDSDAESLELKLPGESSSPKELALWAGVLVLLTLISYWPATTGGFVWRDDLLAQKPWIYAPGGLSLVWMARWSQPGDYVINSPLYQPVALTAYWLEYRLGGRGTDGRPSPMAYHVASLMFHAGAAVLLWLVLRELLVPAAWMITAIFALNPIHSEPISWISEQATVLAGMFFIGSIYCYLMFLNWRARDVAERAAGGEGVDPAQTWGLYAGSVVAFLLAILSDPSTVMLPIVLLLLLWWRKRVTSQDGLLITPMAIIAAVLWISTATLHSGRYEDILLNVRSVPELVMLGRGIWFSLLRTFVPSGLSVLDLSNLQLSSAAAAFFIGVVMVIVLLIGGLLAIQLQPSRTGQRTPASSALVALTAFLLLVITGLNWFDPTRLSLVTDCVGYLAIVPIVALMVGFVSRFKLPGPYPQSAVTVSTVVLIGFGLLSWLRTQAFDSPVALWRDVVAKAPASAFGHEELAEQLRLTAIEDFAVQDKDATKAHRDEAIQNAREAAELDPANFRPQQTWARVLTDRGDDAQALPHYQVAIALAPNIASLHTDYAAVLIQLGRFKQAIPELIAALQLDSGSSDAFRLLGEAHAGLGEIKEALVAENQAILLNPANFLAMQKLAEFQAKGGKPDDLKAAINTYFKLMGESKQMTRPDIWLAISKIKRQQGDLEHALEFLKENETYAKDDPALSKQYEDEIQSITRSLATRPSTRSSTQASTMPATTQAVKE